MTMRRRASLQLDLICLPWTLRRRLLNKLFGDEISKGARIGVSIVIPFERLEMAPVPTSGTRT